MLQSPEASFIAEEVRRAAGYAQAMYEQRSDLEIAYKRDANDVLTEADLGVQRMLWKAIQERFPGDQLIAEEDGFARIPDDPTGRVWVIDPIDGTQNFVRGLFPVFGVSIAFMEGGALKAGAIALPGADEVFIAEAGNGAFRMPAGTGGGMHPIAVSSLGELHPSRLELDVATLQDRPQTLELFSGLVCSMGQIRVQGAATVGLLAVAAGEAEAYVHVGLSLWDYAAGLLLAMEAGGRASRMDGSPVPLGQLRTDLIVTNSVLHEAVLNGIVRA